jgi:hypothetical protein
MRYDIGSGSAANNVGLAGKRQHVALTNTRLNADEEIPGLISPSDSEGEI